MRFRLIAFAEHGTLGGPLRPAVLFTDGLGVLLPPSGGNAVAAPNDVAAAIREQLRGDLTAAIGRGIAVEDAKRLKAAAAQMVATPAFDVERGRRRTLRIRWHYVPVNLEALLAYAVLLLRDETLGLGSALKLCRLPSCGRFFFSERSSAPGRPRAVYCSDEHMLEAHKATSASRSRKWRENKLKKAATQSTAKHK